MKKARNLRMLLLGPVPAVFAVFAIVLQQAVPAFACNPNRSNNGQYYYDSFDVSNLGTIGGVYSTNLVYTPYTPYGTTEVYDKIDNTSNSGTQKAFMEWYYNGSQIWTEMGQYNSGSSCANYLCMESVTGESSGQHNTFTVEYDSCSNNDGSAGYVSYYLNNQNPYPAVDCYDISFTPNGTSISGGMSSLPDQMPGGYSNKETMNSANVYSNGSWKSFYNNSIHHDNGQYSGGDYFGWDAFSSNYYNGDIYDNGCSS